MYIYTYIYVFTSHKTAVWLNPPFPGLSLSPHVVEQSWKVTLPASPHMWVSEATLDELLFCSGCTTPWGARVCASRVVLPRVSRDWRYWRKQSFACLALPSAAPLSLTASPVIKGQVSPFSVTGWLSQVVTDGLPGSSGYLGQCLWK